MPIPSSAGVPEAVFTQKVTPDSETVLPSPTVPTSGHELTGNASALPERFCKDAASQATRYAMSIVRSWSDAEEIVQDAFCKLMIKLDAGSDVGRSAASRLSQLEPSDLVAAAVDPVHDLPSEQRLRATLFAIVRNQSIDRLRSRGRRRFEAVDEASLAETRAQASDANLKQLEASVQVSLDAMPGDWSEALQLKINGELSYEEIAAVLGATHSQVRTWIFRARQRMAKELAEQGLLE